MPGTRLEPVLVYDRIAQNRRRTAGLLLLFGTLPLPLILGLLGYFAELFLVVSVLTLGLLAPQASALFNQMEGLVRQPRVLAGIAAGFLGTSLALLFLMVWLQYRYASRFVLRFTGARPATRDAKPELWRTVENLCIGAGLPQPNLYVVESPVANAFATGLRPDRASLAVTRGLLDRLDRRELEAVIAHELSHIGNYDIRLNCMITAIFWTVFLPVVLLTRFFQFLLRARWILLRILGAGLLLWLVLPLGMGLLVGLVFCARELLLGSTFPVSDKTAILMRIWCGMVLYCSLAVPVLLFLLRRAISREREFLADADAVLLTRNPGALARALRTMSAAAGQSFKASPATAHFYTVEPPALRRCWNRVLSTHPPIEARIERLAQMGAFDVASALLETQPRPVPLPAQTPHAVTEERPLQAPARSKVPAAFAAILLVIAFLAALLLTLWLLYRTGG